MLRYRSGLSLIALASIGLASPQASRFRPLDDYFKDQIGNHRSPAISVAVVQNGRVVYAKGFGYADLENDIPATPETVYRIGSITKQFTATMIMQLIHEGKLSLDQRFRTVLPDTPAAWDAVTVRELLNHTSGIKSYTEIPGLFDDAALKPTMPAGILKTVATAPLDFAPGSSWHYDNTGYEILGMLIEKLDGRPYTASLHARILDPVGMHSTYFTSERTVVKNRAQGYDPSSGAFRHAAYLNMDWPYAAGSIESTVLDLAKWDAALYGDKVLPQASLRQMWTPTVLTSGKTQDYGFGWSLGKVNGIGLVEHGGGIHGFTTFIRRAPAKGLTVIVLTNSGDADPQKEAVAAMGLVDPTLKPAPAPTVSDRDPAATLFARQILQSILDGKLDRSKLTPEFSKFITPELEKGAHEQLASMGPVKAFRLVADKSKPGEKIRDYQATLGIENMIISITQDAHGLISGIALHP